MIKFEHDIVHHILLDERSPIRKANRRENVIGRELKADTEVERYIFLTGQAATYVTAALDKSALSIEILRTVGQSPQNLSNVAIADQISFAIENYIIRSATVYDRAMIFVNQLIDLGVAANAINHDAIITNEHVIRSGLVRSLKALRKACFTHRDERNAIIHHRSYSDETFDSLRLHLTAHEISVSSGQGELYDPNALKVYTEHVVGITIEEFETHLTALHEATKNLFNESIPIYDRERQKRIGLASVGLSASE